VPEVGRSYALLLKNNPRYAVDVPNSSHSSGQQLQMYDANGTKAQSWTLTRSPDPQKYFFRSVNTPELCLGADPTSFKISQFECGISATQYWTIDGVNGASSLSTKNASQSGFLAPVEQPHNGTSLNAKAAGNEPLSRWYLIPQQ
jgi:hypothetical protein